MTDSKNPIPISRPIILFLLLANLIVISQAYINNEKWYRFLLITAPLFFVATFHARQKRRAQLTLMNKKPDPSWANVLNNSTIQTKIENLN